MENREKFDELFWRHEQLGQTSAAVADKKTRNLVVREREKIGREMAAMLGTPTLYETVPLPQPRRGTIKPVLRIEGLPSKKGRDQAAKWMQDELGITWDGSITQLRKEIWTALKMGYAIPYGRFDGTRIDWTVEIDDTTERDARLWDHAIAMARGLGATDSP